MNESKNARKNISMMLTGMVIGAALTGGSIAAAAGITAEPTWQPIFVDGQQVEMQAYNIAGHNYVKLRDMGKQVGFNVYWNAGVQIDTGHPYTGIAPAASGIRVSSYKGSTLRPGDRSGLNISPSEEIKKCGLHAAQCHPRRECLRLLDRYRGQQRHIRRGRDRSAWPDRHFNADGS